MRCKLVKSQAFPGSRFGNKRLVGLMSLEDFCPQARRLGYHNPSPRSSSLVPRAATSSGWSRGHGDRALLPPPHLQSQGWHQEGHPLLSPGSPTASRPAPISSRSSRELPGRWLRSPVTYTFGAFTERRKALGFLQSNF